MSRYNPLRTFFPSRATDWPDGDILAVDRGDFPPIPVTQLRPGVVLYHGTAVNDVFTMPRSISSFSTSVRLAWDYAKMESEGDHPRVLTFRVARRIPKLIDFPSVSERDAYRNATFRLSHILKTDFSGVGYQRKPEAFAAICASEYNGLLIRRNDGGATDLLLCRPDRWLAFEGETRDVPARLSYRY